MTVPRDFIEPSKKARPKILAIQGLRGVAVLLVVLCHLEVPFFQNGFIGVDIFFVISGFLITQIMVKEYVENRKASRRQGWISFVGFYARRIRRIVPAAYFVILIVTVIGTILPKAVSLAKPLTTDATWAALFLSNLNYADQATEYFGESNKQSPFLHYWSLAVEEQFYLFWPVFFLTVTSMRGFKAAGIIFNWRNRLRTAMLVVSFLSFGAYLIFLFQNSPSSYFSSIARFWEFSIGALFSLSSNFRFSEKKSKYFLVYLSILVVSFFVISIFQMRVISLAYVLLTGFVLSASVVNQLPKLLTKILENRFFCFIGKISFSLYLVHWPIIVFTKNLGLATSGLTLLFLLPVMILVSMFLFKEVEERFLNLKIPEVSKLSAARRTRYFPLNHDKLKYSSILIFVFILSMNFQVGDNKPLVTTFFKAKVVEPWVPPAREGGQTFGEEARSAETSAIPQANVFENWTGEIVKGLQSKTLPDGIQPDVSQLDSDRISYWRPCITIVTDSPACNRGQANAKQKVYILGDSHALSLSPMIFGTFSGSSYQVVARYRGQCMVPDVATINNGKLDLACAKHRDTVNKEILSKKPFLVIAFSKNSGMIKGNRQMLEAGMVKEYSFLVNSAENVVVIGDTPGLPDPRICIKSTGALDECVGSATSLLDSRDLTARSAAKAGAYYLDITPWMCFSGKCPPIIKNHFVTWDGSHLTAKFSEDLSPLFSQKLIEFGLTKRKTL
jgi:peptidoglycan/LPS O-acetylase OafA/YrhL